MSHGTSHRKSFFAVGGTVQAHGGIYIPREADERLFELCCAAEFAYVLSPRQVGKSSLMVQTAARLAEAGIESVIIDLNEIGVQRLDAEAWYLGLLVQIGDRLTFNTDVISWWEAHSHLGITQRLVLFFQKVLLVEVKKPVVIFIDEIDTTLKLDFTDDFFAAIRFFYNDRALSVEMRRLSFVLIGVATPGDLIQDNDRTPFNIGSRVDLTDWTLTEALPVISGFKQSADDAKQMLAWVLKWTGGHPYLTMRLCKVIEAQAQTTWTEPAIDQLVSRTFLGEESENDSNLQFVRGMLTEPVPELPDRLTTYREIRRNKRIVLDEEQSLIKSHLKLSGIVIRENRKLSVRNPIYREVFNDRWIREHLPVNWQQRLRRAAYALALIFVLVSIPTTGIAILQGNQAKKDRNRALELALQAQEATRAAEEAKAQAEYERQGADRAREMAVVEKDNANVQKAEAEKQRQRAEELRRQAEMTTDKAKQSAAYAEQQRNLAQLSEAKAKLESARATESAERERKAKEDAETQKGIAEEQTRAAIAATKLATMAKREAEDARSDAEEALKTLEQVEKSVANFKAIMRKNKISIKDTSSKPNAISQATGTASSPLDGVRSAAFDKNGNTIVTAGEDGIARVWKINDPHVLKPKFEFIGSNSKKPIETADFTPDGKYLFTAGDASAAIWTSDGKKLLEVEGDGVSPTTVALSTLNQDGSPSDVPSFLVARNEGYVAVRKSAKIEKDDSPSRSNSSAKQEKAKPQIVALPSRRLIFTINSEGEGRIWNDGKPPVYLNEYRNPLLVRKKAPFATEAVTYAAFSPDGKLLVTASGRKARVWDTTTGNEKFRRRGHEDDINGFAFSPNGEYVVTWCRDGIGWVWESKNGRKVSELHDYRGTLINFERGRLGSLDYASLRWPRWKNVLPLTVEILHRKRLKPFTTAAISPAATTSSKDRDALIVTGSEDGSVRVWDLQSGKKLIELRGPTGKSINIARFSADGKYIVTAGQDGTARVWDVCEKGDLLDQSRTLTKYCSARK